MSNLKKILALVLALVMSFSLVTVSSAALKDTADIDETYAEAAQVLEALEIFRGDNNGNFNPKNDITRAEVAALIYRIHTGDVEDLQDELYVNAANFKDEIPAWAKGYVGYCASNNLVKGYEDGTFRANGKVTGFEALVMILRAIGYGQENEFTGINWSTNAASIAKQREITDNVKPGLLVGPATREVVAEILFRAITVNQVTYTPAFGYVGADILDRKGTLGWQNFNLFEVEGMITDVTRNKGITVINGYNVANTDADWKNIGYQAETYVVMNSGSKTCTAVSDVQILGEVMGSSNNGTPFADLIDVDEEAFIAEVDWDEVELVRNGQWITTNIPGSISTIANIGVNVDFVDNDVEYLYAGGLTDTVIVTDYTAATVTGVAKDFNKGQNAIVKDAYYFTLADGTQIKVDIEDVIGEELDVGDVITYVVFKGEYYVTVAPEMTRETFKKIGYDKIFGRNEIAYTLGTESYLKVEVDFLGNNALLTQDNVGEDVMFTVDPYGHLLKVAEPFDPSEYLYVVRTNHSNQVEGTTFATVVLAADASVLHTNLKKSGINVFGEIAADMYTFTAADGIYTLGKDCDDKTDEMGEYTGAYVKGNPNLDTGVYFTNASVIIDVTNVKYTDTVAKVYESYKDLPSMKSGTFHYVVDENGFVVVAFLSAMTAADTELAEKEFMVYHTDAHYYAGDYYMDVIVDGEIVVDYKLSKDEYADICKYGVGLYNYAKITGTLTYKSFSEIADKAIVWQDGTVVVGGTAYAYDDANVDFFTLDIAEGDAWDYTMVLGKDALAYVVTSGYNATEIYVVYGDVATTGTTFDANGNTYIVAPGKITSVTAKAEVSDGVSLAAYQTAQANIQTLVNALITALQNADALNAPYRTAATTAQLTAALQAIVTAEENLVKAVLESEALYAKLTTKEKALVADKDEQLALLVEQADAKYTTVVTETVTNGVKEAMAAYDAAILSKVQANIDAAVAAMANLYVLSVEVEVEVKNAEFVEVASKAAVKAAVAGAYNEISNEATTLMAELRAAKAQAKDDNLIYVYAADTTSALTAVLAEIDADDVKDAAEELNDIAKIAEYVTETAEAAVEEAWNTAVASVLKYLKVEMAGKINALNVTAAVKTAMIEKVNALTTIKDVAAFDDDNFAALIAELTK